MNGSPRVFVALPLGAEAADRAMGEVTEALGGASGARRRFRLPRTEGLHATLLFLGEVAEAELGGLQGALAAAIAGARAPRLALGGAGSFPRRGRERVLWLGVREEGGGGRLATLHRAVLEAAKGAGFDVAAEERRGLVPHVTVARPRDPRHPRVPEAFYRLSRTEPWHPEEAVLLESVRAEGPNRYVPRARFPLAP